LGDFALIVGYELQVVLVKFEELLWAMDMKLNSGRDMEMTIHVFPEHNQALFGTGLNGQNTSDLLTESLINRCLNNSNSRALLVGIGGRSDRIGIGGACSLTSGMTRGASSLSALAESSCFAASNNQDRKDDKHTDERSETHSKDESYSAAFRRAKCVDSPREADDKRFTSVGELPNFRASVLKPSEVKSMEVSVVRMGA